MERQIAGIRVSFSPVFNGTVEEFIRIHQHLYELKVPDEQKKVIKELRSIYKEIHEPTGSLPKR